MLSEITKLRKNGKPCIRLYVDKNNKAKIEVPDERGYVINL